jgi:hypothetical protein
MRSDCEIAGLTGQRRIWQVPDGAAQGFIIDTLPHHSREIQSSDLNPA